MKTIRLERKRNFPTFFLFTLMFCVLAFMSCDTEDEGNFTEENEENIRVDNVEWKSDLKSGYEIAIDDKSLNIANRVTISPEDASNQEQAFSSSNQSIATVSEQGQVTPLSLGTTTITVTVDEMTDEFTLKVMAQKVINVSSITVEEANIELELNATVNLASKYNILPVDATNKEVTYSSSEPSIVSIDDQGVIEGLEKGSTTITVTSVDNPAAKGEFNVTVIEVSFKGDYSREGWTLKSSQDVFDEGSNSLTSPLDDDIDTWFGLVKPGKSWKEVSIPDSEGVYFIVDMKEEKTVNYFKIRHRNDSQIFLRYRLIEEVYGSNDGENFTLIASDVSVTDYELPEPMSPNLSIPESTYRYFKFYCKKEACFDPSRGSTAQMSEFYLGVE
ncbi:Ig-like domain-containing protein [Leeuwenhoekiella polynyae]|uniref:F5/8 type C domain-containing protein n=1 Tax=Leeuwenhoekiella polynyae TaxID=1550906 RepID=A0A4Q0PJE8_9FLAO|nr:Ig-like domain-containing protein [Leeuwenhoekiella polynyae]RXG26471.1 F5/8 type C domain-containing protein [Leeuwenhoekiella polynyae]